MKKKLLILLGLLVFIFVVLAYLFGRGPHAHTVTTEPLAFRDIVERVSASGKIQPEVEVKITAEVNGQIIALPVKEGDVVRHCLLYTSPSPRDRQKSRMPSSA